VRRRAGKAIQIEQSSAACYRFAGWNFDVERRVLRDAQGNVTSLSEGEFSLLRAFVERPQRVLSRDQLLEYARGAHSDAYDRAIDTQISRLRRKLGIGNDDLIRTIRNEGYMFVPKVTLR
jgi:two-component system OmpR family response regulator